MRSDPGHHAVDVVQRLRFRRLRPPHDDHLDPEPARRLDLRIGRASAAVLGDERSRSSRPASARVRPRARTARARGSAGSRRARRLRPADRSRERCSGAAARGRRLRAAAAPGSGTRSCAAAPSASTASSIVATSFQRSPSCRTHGGRVKTTSGVAVARQAERALADMRAANGWVASTTTSMRSERR